MSEQPHSQGPQERGPWRLDGLPAQKGAGASFFSPTVWSTEGALTEGVRSQGGAETLGKPGSRRVAESGEGERVLYRGPWALPTPLPLVRKFLHTISPSITLPGKVPA